MALSCVTSLETGGLDIDPQIFGEVVSVTSGNSIYATETMFRDPSNNFPFYQLRHLVGNVGKPGIALLLSSQCLEPPEIGPSDWQYVDSRPFDGRHEDHFKSTSVHLWLTGYEQALQMRDHGARDKEIYYLEAITSAYEANKKVADIDFLRVSSDMQVVERLYDQKDPTSHLCFLPSGCAHDTEEKLDASIFGEITALDNWFEVIDRPQNSAIIRANKNWLARLCLTAMCLQMEREMVIFSEDHICWACAKESLGIEEEDPDEKYLFLC